MQVLAIANLLTEFKLRNLLVAAQLEELGKRTPLGNV
jgi:hypothetical protein